MNDAVRVEIEPERVTAHGIREALYHVASWEKLPLLLGLLERDRWERTLIFVNRKTTAAELVSALNANGHPVAILAGNQNAPNLRKRVDGVKQAAAKYPKMKIVDTFYHIETPQDAAAEVLRVQGAYPEVQGWAMIGGWPLFTQTLLTDLDPKRVKIVAVDGLPAELPYVEKGLAPVLLAQPTYLWGYVSVQKIYDKVHDKKDVPAVIPMELVRVTKDNLGTWARQLRDWGFTDVPDAYTKMP
jgi:ribose transport system substrate-binding protein